MTESEHFPALSSVVQLRLRDHARRPVAEQARLSAQLATVLSLLVPDMPPRERIVLEGADGAVVAVLANPAAALALAERAMRATGLGLSIGIDHGPIEPVSSDAGLSLNGDGVSTAALMATLASEAGLLVTDKFRAALAQAVPGAQHALVPAGDFSDAGLRTYQAYSLDREAPGRRRRRLLLAGASALGLMLIGSLFLQRTWEDRPRPLAPLVEQAATLLGERIHGVDHGQR